MKNVRFFFYLKNCHFLEVKVSIYLNRRVFVMNVVRKIIKKRNSALLFLDKTLIYLKFDILSQIAYYSFFVTASIQKHLCLLRVKS